MALTTFIPLTNDYVTQNVNNALPAATAPNLPFYNLSGSNPSLWSPVIPIFPLPAAAGGGSWAI